MKNFFGPNRVAALDERVNVDSCCICDRLIRNNGKGKRVGKYTCGREVCKRAWGSLIVADAYQAIKEAKALMLGAL